MNSPGPFGGYWLLLFTCQDCLKDCVRLTRTDPELVRRCLICEPVAVRKVSERILTEVFGSSDWMPSTSL